MPPRKRRHDARGEAEGSLGQRPNVPEAVEDNHNDNQTERTDMSWDGGGLE